VVATGAVGRVAAQAAFQLAGPRGDPPGGKLASAAVRPCRSEHARAALSVRMRSAYAHRAWP